MAVLHILCQFGVGRLWEMVQNDLVFQCISIFIDSLWMVTCTFEAEFMPNIQKYFKQNIQLMCYYSINFNFASFFYYFVDTKYRQWKTKFSPFASSQFLFSTIVLFHLLVPFNSPLCKGSYTNLNCSFVQHGKALKSSVWLCETCRCALVEQVI